MALRRVPVGTISRFDNPIRRRHELLDEIGRLGQYTPRNAPSAQFEDRRFQNPADSIRPLTVEEILREYEARDRLNQYRMDPNRPAGGGIIPDLPPVSDSPLTMPPQGPYEHVPSQFEDTPMGLTRGRRGEPSPGGPVDEAIKATVPRVPGMTEAHWKAIAHIESALDPDSNSDRSTQYKGLFQIGNKGKDSEWAKNGSGDIYNPMDNAKAAQKIFESNAAYFNKTYGRDPTPAEGYLMHQQGRGYFKGSLTNPGGNPPPRSVGGPTSDHAEFGARWTRAVNERAAQFAKAGASTQPAVAGPGQQTASADSGFKPIPGGLTPEEANLYKMHRDNLVHPDNTTGANGKPRSSLLATTVEHGGRTYIIPTMRDGKTLQPSAAVDRAMSEGIQKFPSYASQEEANVRYAQMHDTMAQDTKQYQENPTAFAGAGGVPTPTPKGTVLPFKPESYYQNPDGTARDIPGFRDRGTLNPYVLPITKGSDGVERTAPPRVVARDSGDFAVVPSVDPRGRFIPPDTINELAQRGNHYGTFDTQQNAVGFARQLAGDQQVMQRFNNAPPSVQAAMEEARATSPGRFARPGADVYNPGAGRFAQPNMATEQMTPAEIAAMGAMAPGDRQRVPEPGTYYNQPEITAGLPPGQELPQAPADQNIITTADILSRMDYQSPVNDNIYASSPPPAPNPPTPHPGARTSQSVPTQAGQAGTGQWPSWAAPLTGGGADPTTNPTNFYGTGQEAGEGVGGGGTTFLSDIFGSGFGTGQSSAAPADVGGQMNLGATAPEGGMAGGGFGEGGGGGKFKPTPFHNLVQIPQMQDPNILFNQLAGPEQNYFPEKYSPIPAPPPPPPATPPGMEPPFSKRRRTRFA